MVAKAKKVVAIKRENPIDGNAVRMKRKCPRHIQQGEVTGVAITWAVCDESTYISFNARNHVTMLGACDLLKRRVMSTFEEV